MTNVTELPIGPGQASRAWREPDVDDDELDDVDGQEPAPIGPAAAPPAVELVEIVRWEPRKLRQPLKLVGKTVNWRMRSKIGVDTDAGLMTDENLTDIGEPMAEVLNRYEPTRALASYSPEFNLAVAVYEYAQETAHKAARAQLLAREHQQAIQRPDDALSHLPDLDEQEL